MATFEHKSNHALNLTLDRILPSLPLWSGVDRHAKMTHLGG